MPLVRNAVTREPRPHSSSAQAIRPGAPQLPVNTSSTVSNVRAAEQVSNVTGAVHGAVKVNQVSLAAAAPQLKVGDEVVLPTVVNGPFTPSASGTAAVHSSFGTVQRTWISALPVAREKPPRRSQ